MIVYSWLLLRIYFGPEHYSRICIIDGKLWIYWKNMLGGSAGPFVTALSHQYLFSWNRQLLSSADVLMPFWCSDLPPLSLWYNGPVFLLPFYLIKSEHMPPLIRSPWGGVRLLLSPKFSLSCSLKFFFVKLLTLDISYVVTILPSLNGKNWIRTIYIYFRDAKYCACAYTESGCPLCVRKNCWLRFCQVDWLCRGCSIGSLVIYVS